MIINAYKWGLKSREVKALTVREYVLMELAEFEKKCERLADIRSIRTDIINTTFGLKKRYTDQELFKIPLIDNTDVTVPIKSIECAIKLLRDIEKSLPG